MTLAEILRETGIPDRRFHRHSLSQPTSGLAQGFDEFDAPKETRLRRASKKVVERATEWLEAADPEARSCSGSTSTILTSLTIPRLGFAADLTPTLPRIRQIRWKASTRSPQRTTGMSPRCLRPRARLLPRRGGVHRFLDRAIAGEFRSASWTAANTMVVVTADHGECFENGNYFEHADCLYEGALRVPLIVRYPDGVGAGLRVESSRQQSRYHADRAPRARVAQAGKPGRFPTSK